jgi:hypothetical protein
MSLLKIIPANAWEGDPAPRTKRVGEGHGGVTGFCPSATKPPTQAP